MKHSLDALSRPRVAEAAPPPRRWPAWLIPATIALGFALLFLMLFRDRLLPARNVQVALVLATTESNTTTADATPQAQSADGPMAFQASGWVEPDPHATKATALIDGVVKQIHVLEGQKVAKGQPLADLIDDDHQLALRAAEQTLAMRRAELVEHRATILSAQSALSSAMARARSAEASLVEANDRARRMETLPKGTVSEADIVLAQSRRDAARADVEEAEADGKQAESEIAALESRTAVLESTVKSAEVDVSIAQLALDRTKIVSPIDGRVLRLLAAPGQKKRLGMDDADSSTIAILYDPAHVQVRVDVPLADAAGLQVGQLARVHCSLLPDTVFSGVVTRITGEADVQRNTLQAKVRIENPSDQLRPEMLCRVEFLHAAQAPTSGTAKVISSLSTWIPTDALEENAAWICDPDTKRVNRRAVSPTAETKDGFRRIAEGLKPGEWVVLSPAGLSDGQRVNPERKNP
jgi:multidrug efflux pump subunit AcrA (membrane-fusion protein)